MSFVCLADFKAHAREQLSKSSWDFIEGAADEGITYEDNIAAFRRIRLRPRYLRDVSVVDTRTTIQGQEIQAPICISPTAFHSIAWPDGERSTARAAQEANVCYVTSTYASCPLEDIVAAAPRGLRWFQLYVQSDWELNKQLIRRVEALGFKALVITVDVPVGAKRRQDIRNQLNLVANLMRMDLRSPEERNSTLPAPTSLPTTSFCWNDLFSIQSITRLPIILKGILTKEDAELAVKHNVQGIIVSNHGGRQLDEVPASIDALTEVVAAVKGRVEVYMDGGVRTGNDVLKALALGAKCIFLGRPILWGLTYKGEHGVREVLNILKAEFHTSMALSGKLSLGGYIFVAHMDGGEGGYINSGPHSLFLNSLRFAITRDCLMPFLAAPQTTMLALLSRFFLNPHVEAGSNLHDYKEILSCLQGEDKTST